MFKRILIAAALALSLAAGSTRVLAQAEATNQSAAQVGEAARRTAEHAEVTGKGMAEGAEHAPPPLIPSPTDRETWLNAVWVIIIFVVLLAVLYPTAWKNVLAGLKAREERIRKDIADAEAARGKAEATLREYDARLAKAQAEVQNMLAQATQQAERIAANIKDQAQKESEETKAKALRDIDAARQQAVADVYAQAAELATTVAGKILRRNLNADDQRDLVNQSLEQLQSAKSRSRSRHAPQ